VEKNASRSPRYNTYRFELPVCTDEIERKGEREEEKERERESLGYRVGDD